MSERKTAFLGSVVFHLLIILAAFLIQLTILPQKIFKRIEIIEFGFNESPNNERFISPRSQLSRTSESYESGRKSNLIPKKVELPKSYTESDEPIYVPQHKETAYNQVDLNNKIGQKTFKSDLAEDNVTTISESENEEAVAVANEDYLKSLTNRLFGETGADSPYILEGEITNRRILYKIIPLYPEDVQKTSKVKISFEVNPDGSVVNMIIIQKADPALENNSLDALEKWKFNTISQDVVQKGVITFIYELK